MIIMILFLKYNDYLHLILNVVGFNHFKIHFYYFFQLHETNLWNYIIIIWCLNQFKRFETFANFHFDVLII